MAYMETHFFSDVLRMGVPVSVILPEYIKKGAGEKPCPTLYLLHGLSDDHTMWMRRTSIERYADEHRIAVVMPEVARSWYTDTADGAPYLTFVGEELPSVCRGFFRGMSERREDTWIAGLSMGGYGALKTALTYPERFGGCASLSGALDILRRCEAKKSDERSAREWRGIFGFDLRGADDLRDGRDDLFGLARRRAAAGEPFPRMFLWCGTEDSLLDENRRFHALLTEGGIAHRYAESEGNHSWQWWDLHIREAIRFLSGGGNE